MTILRSPTTRLHPDAPPRREPRPFGQGILPIPTAKLDGIPPSVNRVRLVAGSLADGEYRRDGDRWARESDGGIIGGQVADREYRDGRLAILADAPMPSLLPTSSTVYVHSQFFPSTPRTDAAKAGSRRGPSAEDFAFEAGRSTALLAECPVEAPAGYTSSERAAWDAGVAEAGRIIQARHDDHIEDLENRALADEFMSAGIARW